MRYNYRKNFYLIGACAWVIPHGLALAADSAPPPEPVSEFQRAFFDDATFTLHLRSYLLDRYDDPDPGSNDPGAWALGGWAGYETGWIGDVLKFGVVGYTSSPCGRRKTVTAHPPQPRAGRLFRARPGLCALKFEEQVLTLFRQIVNQPEVNAQDNRMTPNTFEGGTLKGELGPFSYYAGVLTAMKKRNAVSSSTSPISRKCDETPTCIWAGWNSRHRGPEGETSLYVVPGPSRVLLQRCRVDDAGHGGDTKLRLSGQFMIQGPSARSMLDQNAVEIAWIGGFKGDVIWNGLTLTAGYTMNGDDNNWQSPYGSWPGYTGMIVEDFNRAEEQALLVGASFDFRCEIGAEGLVFTALAAFDLHVADRPAGAVGI
jgi:hypothetical protein